MNSFMSWVGGKKSLRDAVLARFPPYYERYIEVFGGAGWILFHKPPGNDFEVYNDFNSNLVNLYRCVRDNPNKLKYKLRYVLDSREDFEWIASLHKRGLLPRFRDYDRAAKFYQLVRYSYASGLDSFGSQPHSIWSDFPMIDMAARRLQKVVIENKDFEKLIRQYDRPVSFFYCDPPYFATENYYKDVGFTTKDHIRLRDTLLGMLNGEKYLVNFEYMGQEMTTVNIDCGTFENHLKRGNANGYKVNEDDEPLANALFGLFAVGTETFTADTAIKTAISDETGYFEFTEIPYGEYVIREIAAPDGYILSDKQYPVTINENGDTVEITAENEAITVEISKQDIYGSELAGAEMQLVDENGEVIDEWVSDGTNHIVTELPVGKYTLKETAAPDGYIIATDISLEVFADGSAIVENVDATATTEDGDPLIVMVDDTTKVEISKLDITNDEELVGATLQIIDENGEVIEEWVSTNEPHYIEAKLIAGKTYTLKETIAPDGYTIANSIDFTVNEDGTVNTVVMYDEPIPDTPDTPTGDTTSRLPGYALITAGVALMVFALMRDASIRRKKKDSNADDYAALCPDFIESEE